MFAGHWISRDGRVMSQEARARRAAEWLPFDADHDFFNSLMDRVVAPE